MKERAFFTIFEGLPLKQIKKNFLEGESPTLSPKCICSLENESILHFFLYRHYYIPIRKTLFEEIKIIDVNLLKLLIAIY